VTAPSIRRFRLLAVWALVAVSRIGAYEVSLHGGPGMNIPEAWTLDDSDPTVPSWYAPDRGAAAEAMLWAPGTWAEIAEFVTAMTPNGAQGDIVTFSCWDGEAALADWRFETGSGAFRGWFLFVAGTGPDVRISAIAAEEDFAERQAFLLSVLDSYVPGDPWVRSPGAVSRFLELSGEAGVREVRSEIAGRTVVWEESPAGQQAAQDVIEREALVLASYAGVPELFYPAWRRYYRLIYRDSYRRFDSLANALLSGPLPASTPDRDVAEVLLEWLQGFSYGSTDGFSDLLAPSIACARRTGDCDSLALALLILLDRYGVDGRLLLSHQAAHAVAALDIEGRGLRYTEGDRTWLTAELTSALPLGVLPDRLDGVNDWFSIDFATEE